LYTPYLRLHRVFATLAGERGKPEEIKKAEQVKAIVDILYYTSTKSRAKYLVA